MQSALLWYTMFTECLEYLGYELNPYDLCVANKMVNDKQLTVAYYVDDLFASHVEMDALKDLKDQLEVQFGTMDTVFGDRQTYLGIDLYFNRKDKTCEMTMKSHLKDAINTFSEYGNLNGKVPTSAAKRELFLHDTLSKQVPDDKQKGFRTVVAKLLFVGKRTRVDILTSLSYLTTRLGIATYADWQKLRRLMQYVKDTIHLPHIIGADSLTSFQSFVDVSYAVHNDMRSHTGTAITFGRGTVYAKSSKQKLNVKSSTEGEIVGASDSLPFHIWTKHFMDAQGFIVEESELNQDNMAGIRVEKNGWISCNQKSRHINVRYFFVKDRLHGNNIKVTYCPTERMIADFLTKPLQGRLFRLFRAVLMGHITINELMNTDDEVLDQICKERVEQWKLESK